MAEIPTPDETFVEMLRFHLAHIRAVRQITFDGQPLKPGFARMVTKRHRIMYSRINRLRREIYRGRRG